MMSATASTWQMSGGTVLERCSWTFELSSMLFAVGLMAGIPKCEEGPPTSTAPPVLKGARSAEITLALFFVTQLFEKSWRFD